MLERTRTRFATVFVLALLSSLAACGDSTGLEGDPLSEAEIQALFDQFASAFSSLNVAPAASASGPQAVTVAESFEVSAPCMEGGAIDASGSVNGSVDDQTFASDLSFELVFDPVGCVVATTDGSITVDGDPDVRIVMDAVFGETGVSMSGSEEGGIRFTSSDGRTGACSIDVQFSTTTNSAAGSVEQSVSGTVCGVSVSEMRVFGAG